MFEKRLQFLLYLAVLIALPFGIWGITASGPTPLLDRLVSFGYGFANGLLFASLLLLFSFLHKKVFLSLVLLINLLSYSLAFLTILYYFEYGYPFSSASVIVILETSDQEASEFLSSFNLMHIILFTIGVILIHFLIIKLALRLCKTISVINWKPKAVFILSLGVIYGCCILKNDVLFQDNMFSSLKDTYRNYKEEIALIVNQQLDTASQNLDLNITRDTISGDETYVLVIGEALSRHHMSLYGYQRETSPELKKLKDELLIFNDVVSPSNTTVQCLKKILTFANCDDMEALANKPGLLQVLNTAGFDTYWISNQCYSGAHDTWATLFSKNAKEKIYTNFVNTITRNQVFDEAVLQPLQKVLAKSGHKKFIIIHLIGSHQRADFRYPVSYSKFSSLSDQPLTHENAGIFQKRYVNSYDNSVLYNDHIVSEIIRLTKVKKQHSFVLYFPDHGEEVCEESDVLGHSDGVNSRYMVEIPMIFWQSEDFKRLHSLNPQIVNRPYQTDDIIHSIIDLLQIQYSYYKPEKSVFNPSYQPEQRLIECRYDYDQVFGRKPKE